MKTIAAFLAVVAICAASVHVGLTSVTPNLRITDDTSEEARWASVGGTVVTIPAKWHSMANFVRPADRLLCEPYDGGSVKNRIVLLAPTRNSDGLRVAHLVLDETKTHVYTTGTNNRRSDGWVSKSKIGHVVVTIVRK